MCKVFLLLCISFSILKLTLQGCEETNLSSDSVILTCANNTLSFPTPKKNVVMLFCLDCSIPVLDQKTVLKKFEGESFNLSNSHVQVISTNAFKSFRRTMRRFLFKNNEINYVAPAVFNNFSLLEEINFRNSRITQLEPDVFNGTITSNLDLSQNLLSNVSRILDGLRTTSLNLSTNRIKEISENTFDHVTFGAGRMYMGYALLDLSNNVIQRIYPHTFKSSERRNFIYMLVLSNNLITTIESKTFEDSPLLAGLYLNQNLISNLYSDSFRGLTSLVHLNLGRNRIQKIPTSLFADLQMLQVLDLSQNYLSGIDPTTFSGLQNLQFLNLSHNNLRVFEDVHLFPLLNLATLDITDTKIHSLNLKTILQHHWRLMILIINDNFWTCKQLTKMYKQLNRQFNGFSSPAKHFDVPNLHGIACSKEELKSYDTLTFGEFLNIIAQESVDPNSFIDDEIPVHKIVENVINNIAVVKSMTIIIAIVLLFFFLQYVIRYVLFGLQHYDIVKNSKFSFFYNQNQDTVKVLP